MRLVSKQEWYKMTRWEARELDSEDDNSHAFMGCLKCHELKATAFRFAASNPVQVMFYNSGQ